MKNIYANYNLLKINNFFVLFFMISIFIIPFTQGDLLERDLLCIITFAINGLIFISGIYIAINKYILSIELIYWIFMFFFMYFAPMLQYQRSQFPWNGRLQYDEIILANFVILLFNIFFVLGKWMAKRLQIRQFAVRGHSVFLCHTFEYGKKARISATILMCLLTIYSIYKTGLLGIVTSRDDAIDAFYYGNSSAIELVVESIVPAFMAYTVAEAAHGMIKKRESGIRFFVTFICLLICFFPTTLPRYKFAVIYGVIFLVVCPWIRKNNRFFWVFTLAMFIVFPLLGGARRVIELNSFKAIFQNGLFGIYLEEDYDAYRMIVSVLRFVKNEGITWGTQLIGAMLFFVPRSLWSLKPVGSGVIAIQNELGSNAFSNVSCPFIGEGFINFGFMGVIFFGVALGFFVCKMDKTYWKNTDNSRGFSFSPYLFIVFMMFFMLRGDLLSSYAYIIGFIVTGYLLREISKYM